MQRTLLFVLLLSTFLQFNASAQQTDNSLPCSTREADGAAIRLPMCKVYYHSNDVFVFDDKKQVVKPAFMWKNR